MENTLCGLLELTVTNPNDLTQTILLHSIHEQSTVRRSATTLKPLACEVNSFDHLVTM